MFLYDKIIVVDFEATCWEDKEYQKENSEIIEIGICKYVISTGEIEDKRSYYIKPEKSEIGKYCTDLTGITQDKIDSEGVTLDIALKRISKKYSPQVRIWAGFGENDRSMLENDCYKKGIINPFSVTYWDIKALLLVKDKIDNTIGLKKEIERVGEIFEGLNHSAADDAYNAAKLLRYIFYK